ncbi:MAG TPA: hypothetical protein VIZ28_02715 [Chitinophagaceae bacterium]
MKKLLFAAQFILFISFNFFLYLTIVEVTGSRSPFVKYDYEIPIYNGREDFDPSLSRLTSVSDLEAYCDSIFKEKSSSDKSFTFQEHYPGLASSVVRKKFFHGYSSYGFSDNYMALMLEPLITRKWISAIVIPDDIMKHPYAACSQQSIVMMELMKRKGFTTRRVGFNGGKKFGGHFSFEVYYANGWHFFDPNQEPDRNILPEYNRPSIEYLAKNEAILVAAYKHWDPAKVHAVLTNYSYGKPNRFEAPNALIYQKVTKFLSYSLWLFLLTAFLVVRRRYLRLITHNNVRNSRVSVPTIAGEGSVSYYTKTRA